MMHYRKVKVRHSLLPDFLDPRYAREAIVLAVLLAIFALLLAAAIAKVIYMKRRNTQVHTCPHRQVN